MVRVHYRPPPYALRASGGRTRSEQTHETAFWALEYRPKPWRKRTAQYIKYIYILNSAIIPDRFYTKVTNGSKE